MQFCQHEKLCQDIFAVGKQGMHKTDLYFIPDVLVDHCCLYNVLHWYNKTVTIIHRLMARNYQTHLS